MKFNISLYAFVILSFVVGKSYDNYYRRETVTVTKTVIRHKYLYGNYNTKTIIKDNTVYKCIENPTVPTLHPSGKPYEPRQESPSNPTYNSKSQSEDRYPGSQPQSKIIEMICRVNQLRAQVGKKALKVDLRLMNAAQNHSNDQASRKQMSHTGSKIRNFFDRIKNSGYKAYAGSENVAWNQKNIEQVMKSWRNSSGHYNNIIGDFDCFGWGEKDLYWTQVFAKGSACTHQTLPSCSAYRSYSKY